MHSMDRGWAICKDFNRDFPHLIEFPHTEQILQAGIVAVKAVAKVWGFL